MSHKSGEHYSITLSSNGIPNYNTYKSAVMEYQIVVQGKAGNIPAKTAVNKKLQLEYCP
jgi:hypothetical protein